MRTVSGVPQLAVARYQKCSRLVRFFGADLSDRYPRSAEECLGGKRRVRGGGEGPEKLLRRNQLLLLNAYCQKPEAKHLAILLLCNH